MKRLPNKSNRNVQPDLIKSIVYSYVNSHVTYRVKLMGYMMMKYSGLSIAKCAQEIGMSNTNCEYHIRSVGDYKKKDPMFLELYNKVESSILLRTNGIRKRIMYRKYNKPCLTNQKENHQPNTISLTLQAKQRKMHTILSSKRKKNK